MMIMIIIVIVIIVIDRQIYRFIYVVIICTTRVTRS